MGSQKIFDSALELQASVTKTATFNGAGLAFELAKQEMAKIELIVTAVSGTTPTLTPTVEASNDGGSTWKVVASQQAITAAGRYEMAITGAGVAAVCPPVAGTPTQVRLTATLGGTTPSFTYRSFITK